jgi:hypothetical protein
MILKLLKSSIVGNREVVGIYDNIVSAGLYYNEETKKNVVNVAFRDGDSVEFEITKVSYLCNDEGKTIEKLVPAIVGE